MPGKNFVLRTDQRETAAVADAAVGHLARRLVLQLLEESSLPGGAGPARELSLLHVLDHLQQATERLQREAAVAAARAGA
ncbi:response regulator, partial [Kitasatospora sp. NPDC094015]